MIQSSKLKSAVTNGRKPFLTQASRKTREYRRLRDLLELLYKEHGGKEHLSSETQSFCQIIAGLRFQQEILLGKLAAGEAVETSELTRISSALISARRAIREPKRPAARKGRVVSITSGAGAPPVRKTSP